MGDQKTIFIYIPLLDEGTPTLRGTEAIVLGDGLYKLLPSERYDPEAETWEFLPGSIVRCDSVKIDGETILRAVEVQTAPGTFVRSQEIPE